MNAGDQEANGQLISLVDHIRQARRDQMDAQLRRLSWSLTQLSKELGRLADILADPELRSVKEHPWASRTGES